MRTITLVVAALISLASHSLEQRQLLIPSRASEFLEYFGNAGVLAKDSDSVVVQVEESEVGKWSDFVHDRFGLCGGFFDISSEIADHKAPRDILAGYQLTTMLTPYSAPTEVIYSDKVANLVGNTQSEFIRSFLTELTAFDDRSATTTNGTRAADFLAQRAGDLGKGIAGFQVRKVATRTYPNQPSVVATLPGTKPSLPHIVIGGHMDTLSNNKPGADDDGSGSAMVMEALRNITASHSSFERTIDFVWYAAEERGLVGSTNVVRDFKQNQIAVAGAIQFDMTGWVNPSGLHEIYLTDDYTDAGLTQTLENVIKTYLPKVTIGHASCGYACSDHASWTAGGVPSTYPFESHHDDYNRRIHTSSDKMDYLSLAHMTTFAKIGVAFLGQMAVLQ
jgi:leucyl aminopeptidase